MKPTHRGKMPNVVAGLATLRSKWMVTITMLMFAALAVVGAPSVQAGDGKVYPGSMGVRSGGTSTPKIFFSAIGNPSTDNWLYVHLPIINDSNNGIQRGWVRVIDMNSRSNITCSLNAIYRSGPDWYGWWTPARSSSGKASYDQILTFGSVGGSGIAHFYYSASIPPMDGGNTSYITSYRAEER